MRPTRILDVMHPKEGTGTLSTASAPRTLHRHRGTSRHPHATPSSTAAIEHGRVRSRTARFAELQVTYHEHGPVHLDGDLAWGTDPDTLRFFVVVDGEVILAHPDASATLGARDSALILGTSPVTYVSEGLARIVTCDIPVEHSSLATLPRSAPFVVGRVDAAVPSALGAFLLDLLRQNADKLDPLARAQTADVLRTLAFSTIMALAVEGDAGWDLRRQRQAALRYIASRYTDPELNSFAVAEHLGLSRRSLQRLFENEDRTIAQYISDVRTRHAITRLRDPRLALASIAEIATLSGFGSSVAMRRAVQEATGGKTPTDLRREAAGDGGGGSSDFDDETPAGQAGAAE